MALFPVAGCRMYIGGIKEPTNVDFTASDFSSETWTEVDGFSQMGAFGDAAALITTSLINRDRDIKQKGTSNAGSMQCVFAVVGGDSGQTKMLAAAAGGNKSNYATKIEMNDEVGVGQPSKRYFSGLYTTAQEAGGQANTIRNFNVTIEINSNVVAVAAA